MFEDLTSLYNSLKVPVFLAMFGAFARVGKYGIKSGTHFLGAIIVAGFTGAVIHLVLLEVSMSEALKSAIVAASGYSGGAVIDAFSWRVQEAIKYSGNNFSDVQRNELAFDRHSINRDHNQGRSSVDAPDE